MTCYNIDIKLYISLINPSWHSQVTWLAAGKIRNTGQPCPDIQPSPSPLAIALHHTPPPPLLLLLLHSLDGWTWCGTVPSSHVHLLLSSPSVSAPAGRPQHPWGLSACTCRSPGAVGLQLLVLYPVITWGLHWTVGKLEAGVSQFYLFAAVVEEKWILIDCRIESRRVFSRLFKISFCHRGLIQSQRCTLGLICCTLCCTCMLWDSVAAGSDGCRDTCSFYCEAGAAVCQWHWHQNGVTSLHGCTVDLSLLLRVVLTEGDSGWVSTEWQSALWLCECVLCMCTSPCFSVCVCVCVCLCALAEWIAFWWAVASLFECIHVEKL